MMVVAIPFCGFWTKAIAITHMAMTRDATPVGLERGDRLDTVDVMLYTIYYTP
jgi:hypothetical protein